MDCRTAGRYAPAGAGPKRPLLCSNVRCGLYKYSRAHAFLHTNHYSTSSPIASIHKYQKRLRYVGENSISDLAVLLSTLLKKKLTPQHTSWCSHAYGCLNNRSRVFQPTPLKCSQCTLLLVDRGINISYMHSKLMIRT